MSVELQFTLGGEHLAIEARWLLGVSKVATLAALPGAQLPLRGVTVWQGELLTVLDIRSLLGISTAALSDMTRLLVVGESRPKFGLLVDTVGDCVEAEDDALLPPPESSPARQFLRGVTSDARLALDGQRILELLD